MLTSKESVTGTAMKSRSRKQNTGRNTLQMPLTVTPPTSTFISEPPTDGSSMWIPTLKYKGPDGQPKDASTNKEKTKVLSQVFFPPKPDDINIPAEYPYPNPVEYPCIITSE